MRTIVVFGLCAIASLALADVYKWVDADGKVHYSDQKPPASVSAKKLPPPPPPADPEAAKRLAEHQLALKKAADAEAAKQKKSDEAVSLAKQKEEFCAQARGQLQALQSGAAPYRYNEKGQPEVMSNEARLQSIRDLEDQVAKNCT